MNLLGIGDVIDSVGKFASDLIITDKERLQMALEDKKLDLEGRKIDQANDLAQFEVNKAEATSGSLFVAGWRPAIGWVGVVAMAYQFLAYPLMQWLWVWGQGKGWIPSGLLTLPVLDADKLWVILSGILGIAGLRTVEKSKGIAAM